MTNPAEWLLRESGLTGAQLGRAMGVGVRTFHSWASGIPVPGHHEKRLSELQALVQGTPGQTPADRRCALLSGGNGRSPFHAFEATRDRGPVIQPVLSAFWLLGIDPEDRAPGG